MSHYKDKMFIETFINASSKVALAEAVAEWDFSHFGLVEDGCSNCQLCHARIKKYVVIKNRVNGVYLFVGHDCYDKFLHYLATEKLESQTMGSRRQYISEIKRYCKKHINQAFLAWFQEQKDLPEEVVNTLKVINALGYAPSLAAAERIVEHYKHNRIFSLTSLLNFDESDLLSSFPHSRLIPSQITLATLPRIQHILDQWSIRREDIRKKQREEVLKRQKEESAKRATAVEEIGHQFACTGRAVNIHLQSAEVVYDSGIYVENGLYRQKYSIAVETDYKGVRISITLPGQYIRDMLGIECWHNGWKNLLMETLPSVLPVVVSGDRIIVRTVNNLESWLIEIKKAKGEKAVRAGKRGRLLTAEEVAIHEANHWIKTQIVTKPEQYKKLSFWRGLNPKNRTEQWESKQNWIKYVLHSRDSYRLEDGEIFVEVVKELVPRKIFLVRRLYLQKVLGEKYHFYWTCREGFNNPYPSKKFGLNAI